MQRGSRRSARKARRSARRGAEEHFEALEHELSQASDVQANLLPSRIPRLPGYDIHVFYRSAKEVGGDYYDFIPVDSDRLAIAIADVSGKGIPGAMIMACTRTLFRMLSHRCGSPSETFRQTNVQISRDIKRGMFVTAMLAFLDVHKREMTVCSAGHNPMVIYRARTDQCELVNPDGMALGFDKGILFDRILKERPVSIEPGDRVVMFTDGVVEAMNVSNELYGEERFYEFIRQNAGMDSNAFIRALIRDLDDHKGKADQFDDITIVTFMACP
jgi:sigma-B regulation protein RsbU (phosphoserine phosphatase)